MSLEQVKEEAKKIAEKYQAELKNTIGELYDKNKEQLAYFIQELAYCQAVVALKIADERIKEDLENLKIGFASTINKLTYKTAEEGTKLFKELFAIVTKVLIQSALSSISPV